MSPTIIDYYQRTLYLEPLDIWMVRLNSVDVTQSRWCINAFNKMYL